MKDDQITNLKIFCVSVMLFMWLSAYMATVLKESINELEARVQKLEQPQTK